MFFDIFKVHTSLRVYIGKSSYITKSSYIIKSYIGKSSCITKSSYITKSSCITKSSYIITYFKSNSKGMLEDCHWSLLGHLSRLWPFCLHAPHLTFNLGSFQCIFFRMRDDLGHPCSRSIVGLRCKIGKSGWGQ